jgi:hypothetical protein
VFTYDQQCRTRWLHAFTKSGAGSKGTPRPQHLGAGAASREAQERPYANWPSSSVGVYVVTI